MRRMVSMSVRVITVIDLASQGFPFAPGGAKGSQPSELVLRREIDLAPFDRTPEEYTADAGIDAERPGITFGERDLVREISALDPEFIVIEDVEHDSGAEHVIRSERLQPGLVFE